MRTLVHLVRHGEVHNPERILYGRLPGFGLSDLGRTMAERAAGALAGNDVTLLLTSPLERARQTAEPFEKAYLMEARADDRLIESASYFEGRTVDGLRSFLDPAALRYLWNPFRPSWGEPYRETAARVLAAVRDARDEAMGHEAVLVSHQLPIYVLRRYVERRHLWHRPDRRQCGLASVTTLAFDDERLTSVTYAEPAGALSRKPATPGA